MSEMRMSSRRQFITYTFGGLVLARAAVRAQVVPLVFTKVSVAPGAIDVGAGYHVKVLITPNASLTPIHTLMFDASGIVRVPKSTQAVLSQSDTVSFRFEAMPMSQAMGHAGTALALRVGGASAPIRFYSGTGHKVCVCKIETRFDAKDGLTLFFSV